MELGEQSRGPVHPVVVAQAEASHVAVVEEAPEPESEPEPAVSEAPESEPVESEAPESDESDESDESEPPGTSDSTL